jgi:hypothetical protein
MSDIINLRLVRKAKKRADAEQSATANRAKHGRSKTEKHIEESEKARAAKLLAGHLLRDDKDD